MFISCLLSATCTQVLSKYTLAALKYTKIYLYIYADAGIPTCTVVYLGPAKLTVLQTNIKLLVLSVQQPLTL